MGKLYRTPFSTRDTHACDPSVDKCSLTFPAFPLAVWSATAFGRMYYQHQQSAFVETHLQDVPVMAHAGGTLNTNVAWSELDKVLFLVNGSRCVLTSGRAKREVAFLVGASTIFVSAVLRGG